MQFKDADPLIFGDVFCTFVLTVIVRSTGAVAVIITIPLRRQVALPVSPMLASEGLEDFQLRPSATVSVRVELSSNLPVAVYCTVSRVLALAAAATGDTSMAVSLR